MKKKLSNSKASLLLSVLTIATLSGCGPNLVSSETSPNERGSAYYSGQSNDANYTCPSDQNILPPDDRVMDGTQRYVACASRTSVTKIKLIGSSSTSQMLCAFPVQYINTNQFLYKLDPYGQPQFKCYDGRASNDNVAELDFPVTNYNGVIVVDQSLRVQMSSCLIAGQACPMHAIGKFR